MIDDRVAVNLDNMQQAAAQAISFVAGLSEAEFRATRTTQMAGAMCLVLIGEACNRIEKRSPEFVADHPDWPWNKMRGLRNVIVHDYDRLNLSIIWRVVTESLPELLDKIDSVGTLDPRSRPEVFDR